MENEVFDGRKTSRKRQFTRCLFLDIGRQHDAVGRATLHLLDFQLFLKIAKRLDAFCGALYLNAVKRVAFIQTELAANHLVLGQRIAVNIDTLNKHPRRFRHVERDTHRQRFFVALEIGVHVGKSITE